MKHIQIALALIVVLTSAVAQTSAPGVCFSFNTATTNNTLPLVAGGDLHFGFTAPISTSIEQIDLSVSYPVTPVITVQVFQWTGTTIGAFLGTGTSLPPNINGVSSLILAAPIPVAAGSTYVLRLTVAASTVFIKGDSAQTTPIPYLLNCNGNPGGTFPPCFANPATGTHGTWMKFRAMSCGQTPAAVATPIGTGCGGSTFGNPVLYVTEPPVLGTTLPLVVSGYFGAAGSAHLFWAAGPATAGLNLGLGGGCTSYLDPVSFQALAAAGLEPIVIFPAAAITNYTTLSIPPAPSLAGVVVTTQALVFASTGIPTPSGTIQISNALQLSLGF